MEILKKIEIKKLAEKINKNGGTAEATLESIIENLGFLATEATYFGEVQKYIPLNIKEILLDLLYPESRVHVTLNHSQDSSFWVAEAFVYLNAGDEKPKGEGRFSYTLKEYCKQNSFTEENGVITIGNWVRGLAKTRAIQSALPFLNLYCEEDVVTEEKVVPTQELPKPEAPEKKRVRKATKTTEITENATVKENTTVADCSNTVELKNETKEMTLEAALSLQADVGQAKGRTLKEIYENRPGNIVWMYNKSDSQLKDALRVIILQDEMLKKYI